MFTSIEEFNTAPRNEAFDALLACCGSRKWVELLLDERPFANDLALAEAADRVAGELIPDDWLEAIASHPRIAARVSDLSAQSRIASEWSSQEQSGTRSASEQTLSDLARANVAYEERFGHTFIVCATGKNSDEMLSLCRARFNNDPVSELQVTSVELRKITQLRLRKLIRSLQ